MTPRDQISMFGDPDEDPCPRKDVQDTSLEAYAEARARMPFIEQKILDCLERHWMTCTEISQETGHILLNIAPAMTHLKDAGLVVKTDDRRPTIHGKPSIVWRLARRA